MTLGLATFHDEYMLDKYPITKWEVAERLHQRKRVMDLTFAKSVRDMADVNWVFKMMVRNHLEVNLNAVYLRQIVLKYLELENVQVIDQDKYAAPELMVQASAFRTEKDDWEWDKIRSMTPREYAMECNAQRNTRCVDMETKQRKAKYMFDKQTAEGITDEQKKEVFDYWHKEQNRQ